METIKESEEEDIIYDDENEGYDTKYGSASETRSSTDACDGYCPDLDETASTEDEDDDNDEEE